MDPVIKIGAFAPHFELDDLHGKRHRLESLLGQVVVLNFWSAECDWCRRVDQELVAHLAHWKDNVEVWWIACNANEPRELIERTAIERNIPIVLIDSDQLVTDLYGAEITPHFFVLGKTARLAYQGAWDDITFRRRTATQKYVPDGVEALLNDKTPLVTQSPPYGCTLLRLPEKPG
jgi:peroxiredoxin